MKKIMLIVVSGLMMVALLAACQAAPGAGGYVAQPHTVSVSGQGQVYLTPDLATIAIGVHSESENVTDALKDNNAKAQAIADALKGMGVDPKDIQTSSFNVFPQQQYGPQGEMTGIKYAVDNTVNVTVRDLTKLGSLLETVVSSGANNINGIQFDVKDREAALSQARQLAINDARKQAEEVANAAGVTLGKVSSINIYANNTPQPLYDAKGGVMASAAAVPVSAGQLLITVDVSMSFEIN